MHFDNYFKFTNVDNLVDNYQSKRNELKTTEDKTFFYGFYTIKQNGNAMK